MREKWVGVLKITGNEELGAEIFSKPHGHASDPQPGGRK